MSSSVVMRRWRLAVRLIAAALVWSLGLVVAALLVPAYDGTTSGLEGLSLTTRTLVDVHGARALILVAIPVIVSIVVAVAVYVKHRDNPRWSMPVAWVAVGLLAVETLLGIVTIGAFMVPVLVLLALSVRLAPGPARGLNPAPRTLATEA